MCTICKEANDQACEEEVHHRVYFEIFQSA